MLTKQMKSQVRVNREFRKAYARCTSARAIQAPVTDVDIVDEDDSAAERLANLKVASFSSQQVLGSAFNSCNPQCHAQLEFAPD